MTTCDVLRNRSREISAAVFVVAAAVSLLGFATAAHAQSGQTAFGQSTVEPAVDDATGNTIFLITPSKGPFPSASNPRAWAPMYIPMYPTSSTIDPSNLDCQPSNCDHLNVLPFVAPGYQNGGQTCTKYGLPADQCSLVIGHDHLVGVPPTGDFNVSWNVILVVFTPKGVSSGTANQHMLTLSDLAAAVMNGEAFEAATPITFNCSRVPSAVYYQGVPLTGF